jgi:RimJ/RimL family protein N-acetyltransferase
MSDFDQDMRVIRTARLALEPQCAAHADEMFAVLADPAIYEYENEPPPSVEWLRHRFTLLESRRSSDGQEHWLNWVVRRREGDLIGYVQATVMPGARALVAYELNSRYWRNGFGREAVAAMIEELAQRYGVHTVAAVFKSRNERSRGLLRALGFSPAMAQEARALNAEADESVMVRLARTA